MFDLLKKKIGGFISAFTKKEEAPQPPQTPLENAPQVSQVSQSSQSPQALEKIQAQTAPPKAENPASPLTPQSLPQKQAQTAPVQQPVAPQSTQNQPVSAQPIKINPIQPVQSVQHQPTQKQPVPLPQVDVEKKLETLSPQREEREFNPKLGILSRIKSVFTSKIAITEAETKGLFEEFELALLESDVSYDTAQALAADLKKRLVGREVEKSRLEQEIKNEITLSLENILSAQQYDFFEKLEAKKAKAEPFKILFIGPNGAGKTTTIAKTARLLLSKGFSSVISASDTFRAAAIEQSLFHGEKLGVKVVKHAYGSDPAAVAFDAIKHAQANKIDAVLIDTAGRQETNKNLVEEMKKISRVCAPDAKIFVGEAIAGHALVEQIKAFKDAVGLDAIILTKVDCDAKGGNSISISHQTSLPILFMGIGQEYADLVPFDPKFIASKIMEN